MNAYIIYILIFPNNKVYIGQTDDFDKRMYQYQWFATAEKSKKYPVYNYLISKKIRKYGWDNIKKEILFTTSAELVDELETKLIAEHKSIDYNFGYNVLEFAKSPRGYKHSDESKEKQSKSMKGKEGYWKGKKRPKFSGKNHPMFGIKNAPMLGKNHSEETKQLIREANLGKEGYWKNKKQTKKHIQKRIQSRKKIISVYNKNGIYINTFESLTQSSKILKIDIGSICNVLNNNRKSAGGYIFKYN